MIRRMRPVLVLATCALCATACDEDKALGPGPCPGTTTYSYTGFTETDAAPFVSGTLELDFGDPGRSGSYPIAVQGTWNLDRTGHSDVAWPSIRSGSLVGELTEDGDLVLELFPGYADLNVGLLGRFDGTACEGITGEWSFVTFSGPTSRGTFTASAQ